MFFGNNRAVSIFEAIFLGHDPPGNFEKSC